MTKSITKKLILAAIIAIAFVVGSITTDAVVFADKAPKTLEEECAKKLDKKKLKLDGLFCAAIIGTQDELDNLARGVQVTPTGAVEIASDEDVILDPGDTGTLRILGDASIASIFSFGPTTIDSTTGNINIGGDLTCSGCVDESDLGFDPATQAELDSKSIDDADADPTNELQTLVMTTRSDTRTISPGAVGFLTVSCQPGEVATGGGWFFLGPSKAKAMILDSDSGFLSGVSGTERSWFVQGTLDSSASSDVVLTGIVKCLKLQ